MDAGQARSFASEGYCDYTQTEALICCCVYRLRKVIFCFT